MFRVQITTSKGDPVTLKAGSIAELLGQVEAEGHDRRSDWIQRYAVEEENDQGRPMGVVGTIYYAPRRAAGSGRTHPAKAFFRRFPLTTDP
jgi:hypothetical protein